MLSVYLASYHGYVRENLQLIVMGYSTSGTIVPFSATVFFHGPFSVFFFYVFVAFLHPYTQFYFSSLDILFCVFVILLTWF